MRLRKILNASFGALIALVATLIVLPPAAAEPVFDRALSGADVLEEKGCAIVRIGFNFRVRYESHFPLGNGNELRIVVRPIDRSVAAAQIRTRREAVRAPDSKRAAIRAIDFELERVEGPTLFIYFEHPVHFKVGQGGDFSSIIVAVAGEKSSESCQPDSPVRADANPWSTTITQFEGPAPLRRQSTPKRPDRELTKQEKKKIAKTMADARSAITKKELGRAIQLLTKILNFPENSYSREAQELLAVTRERKGQLAHARADYEEYLANYPTGEGAERVRQRLAGISTALGKPKTKLRQAKRTGGSSRSGTSKDGNTWSISGSFSQFYFLDQSYRTITDPSLPPDLNDNPDDRETYQNELLSSFDLIAKWGNTNHLSKLRFSGTQETSFSEDDDDEFSVASLYYELALKDVKLVTRVGRQTRNTGGVLGRFDGGLLSWQGTEKLRINGVVGSPAFSRKDAPFENDKYFYGISVDYGPIQNKLDTTVFFIDQRADELVDRQAAGIELRYFDDNKTAFATVDYDLHFNELNTAIFSGSWTFPDKSTFTLGADYRKSPSLFTSNALQGQPVDTLRALLGINNEDEIRQFALDRTATAKSATIGFSRPLNKMLQVNLNATWSNISATEASAGVEASPSTGNEFFYSGQLIGTNVVKDGDIFVAGVRYADRSNSDYYILDLNTRYPITRDFRVNPRLRFSYRENKFNDSTEFAVQPSLKLNYRWTRDLSLELEVGGQWANREQDGITDEELEYFVILGYRYDFYADERKKNKGLLSFIK